MAWRFKVSKYKNAAPRYPKREETILDIPVDRLMLSCGNHISASCNFMAFNTDTGGGGNVGILPLNTTGRTGQSLPLLKAHADFVTDMSFSPFDDSCLATCSSDATVKIWHLPEQERLTAESIDLLRHTSVLPAQEKRVETVAWSPVARDVLATSVYTAVEIIDVEAGEKKIDLNYHGDQIQSMCWRGNSTLIATTCKDKKLRLLDPRLSSVAQECDGHKNNRDSRVVWMGDQDYLISTGFDAGRERELKLWDTRNLKSAVRTDEKDSNNGTLMPLFDEDTSMLFLVGKADTCWSYLEVSTSEPYFTQNAVERSEQIKGACLIPKRAVNVMEGEVNRLLVLIQHSIVPLPYIVPRRQYKDFHEDLFPDTKCGIPALNASQWFSGENATVELMSLNPAVRSKPQTSGKVTPKKPVHHEIAHTVKEDPVKSEETHKSEPVQAPFMEVQLKPHHKTVVEKHEEQVQPPSPKELSKTAKTFASFHQSKCKYLKGITEHPSTHIVNIRRLCRTLPGESNLFYANTKRCAVPMEGSGGLIGILELDKPGRLPDTGIPVIQNGSKVNDMVWDPFDNQRIVVGCENAKVYIWKIPKDGLSETLTEPQSYLMGHTEKVYFVRFHPLAKDVVITSAYDFSLKIWDLQDNKVKIDITCHSDEIFCAEWSPDGRYLATICKDGKIRIFDPRKSLQPIKEGVGPEGSRGARVVWVLNMKYLLVSGFDRLTVSGRSERDFLLPRSVGPQGVICSCHEDIIHLQNQENFCFKSSSRQLLIYSVEELDSSLHTINLGHAPAIFIPYYDEGTSTVFLTGRGENSILAFEVSEELPHLFPLATTTPEGLHQGVALMPKSCCDVRKVEFARMWRLTQSTIEPISFTVPRAKPEYFQDDLFPDTPVEGEPTMTSSEWFKGANKQPKKISLRPADMKPLSEAPVEAPKPQKYESYNPETYKTAEQKKEELLNAITNKLDIDDEPMPQDLAEGVDPDEWDDY